MKATMTRDLMTDPDYPDCSAAYALQQKLTGDLSNLRAESARLQSQIHAADLSGNGGRIAQRAFALLGGRPKDLPPTSDELRARLGEVYDAMAAHETAIAMQKRAVESAREAASRKLCEAAAPAWKTAANRLRTVCRELVAVAAAEREIREGIRDAGGIVYAPIQDAAGASENLVWLCEHLATEIDGALRHE